VTLPTTPYPNFPHILIGHNPIASSPDKAEAKRQNVIPQKGFSGKYLLEISALLDTIVSTKVGRAMLLSIERHGNDVKITFPKLFVATYMKCNHGSPNTTRAGGAPFRAVFGADNPLPAFQEAARISKLSAGSIASFIRNAAESGGAKLSKVNTDLVTAWLDGSKGLPEADKLLYRYLVLALEPWLDYGWASRSWSNTIHGTR
jgi:hypothetical protein